MARTKTTSFSDYIEGKRETEVVKLSIHVFNVCQPIHTLLLSVHLTVMDN